MRCVYLKKDGNQCTNQHNYDGQYCGIHKKYIDMGVTVENRCLDCGKVKEDISLNNCSNCNNKRREKRKLKRESLKLARIEKVMTPLKEIEYEISPFYLSGFFDGDGSICITQGLSLQIQITQCVKTILIKLQNIFGGSLYSAEARNENQRKQHSLRICGRECEKILKYLDVGCIMKWDQIQIGKKFINLNNLQNLEEKKVEYREKMRKLNKSYKKTHDKQYSKINWEYIAGLFDAEGCIFLKKKRKIKGGFRYLLSYIKITQKNDYRLLEVIRDFIGHGTTRDKVCWKTERIDFAKFDLRKMLPLLHVKELQARKCIELLESDDEVLRGELYDQIKADKTLNFE